MYFGRASSFNRGKIGQQWVLCRRDILKVLCPRGTAAGPCVNITTLGGRDKTTTKLQLPHATSALFV